MLVEAPVQAGQVVTARECPQGPDSAPWRAVQLTSSEQRHRVLRERWLAQGGARSGRQRLQSLFSVWFCTLRGAALQLPKPRPHKQRALGGLWVLCNHGWVLEIIADLESIHRMLISECFLELPTAWYREWSQPQMWIRGCVSRKSRSEEGAQDGSLMPVTGGSQTAAAVRPTRSPPWSWVVFGLSRVPMSAGAKAALSFLPGPAIVVLGTQSLGL